MKEKKSKEQQNNVRSTTSYHKPPGPKMLPTRNTTSQKIESHHKTRAKNWRKTIKIVKKLHNIIKHLKF